MKKLTFDEAFRRLKLTLPGVSDFRHESSKIRTAGDTVSTVEVVRYFQHRLNTHVRTIGGWTFLAENAFLSKHVGRIFLAWVHHGGTKVSNSPLEAAMRHCFKRFYAECALAECNTVGARSLLIEAALFEKELLRPIYDQVRDDPNAGLLARTFVRSAQFIAYHHEIGHIAYRSFGAPPDHIADALFEGVATPRVSELRAEGQSELAEEVYCDLYALHELITSPTSPLHPLDPQFKSRLALFGFVCVAYLSLLSFGARSDARRERLGLPPPSPIEKDAFQAASSFIMKRMSIAEDEVKRYADKNGMALYGKSNGFNFVYSPVSLFLETLVTYRDVRPSTDPSSSLCSAEDRDLAKFLALAMANDDRTAQYLLWCSPDPDASLAY